MIELAKHILGQKNLSKHKILARLARIAFEILIYILSATQ